MKWLPYQQLAVGVMAIALVGCGEYATSPAPPPIEIDALAAVTDSRPGGYPVRVVKHGPAGTYNFEASATGGTLWLSTFSLEPGYQAYIWTEEDPTAGTSEVTVTELSQPGVQVDSIKYYRMSTEGVWSTTLYTHTNSVTVPVDYVYGALLQFYNSRRETGGQGCTPGYWRQPQHFDSWEGYAPGDSYSDVFGVAFPGTLLDGVNLGGGGVNALVRHSVAALLNASAADVSYGATADDVISAVQAAFASGEYEAQKNIFEGWNEAGCPLN